MKNKIISSDKLVLIALLITPILIISLTTIYFNNVYKNSALPVGTTNNGIFFKSYFNFNQFKDSDNQMDLLEFEDGKWVMSVYITDINKSKESLYLMRQLNVALNRDINKVKRIAFYSNKFAQDDFKEIQEEYPRLIFIKDNNGVLLNVLQRNSKINFNIENPIFIIAPYGRAVMYFDPTLDPKLILKDLKKLI